MRHLDGVNASNRLGRITIDPDAPERAAIVAQELWEAEWKRDPANALRIRVDSSERKWMEIAGHEVETQAAVAIYGRDEAARRRQEAVSMQRGYGGLFKDMTVAEIEARMIQRRVPARSWVERNVDRLMQWRGKL